MVDHLLIHRRICAGLDLETRPSFDELVRHALEAGLDVYDVHVWLAWAERHGFVVAEDDLLPGHRHHRVQQAAVVGVP